MRGFEVRPVCSRIAIDLEHPDAGRVVPFRDGVEDQHTRLGSDGGLDLLVNRGPVIFNLRGINLDFCDLDVPPLGLFAMRGWGDRRSEHRCAEDQKLLRIHSALREAGAGTRAQRLRAAGEGATLAASRTLPWPPALLKTRWASPRKTRGESWPRRSQVASGRCSSRSGCDR